MDAVAGRLDEILKTDWQHEAELVLAERIRTKQGTVRRLLTRLRLVIVIAWIRPSMFSNYSLEIGH